MEPEKPIEEKRLWIGNLDPRVTEYQLLKLVQKYGSIEKFDLLFHRNGPQAGQPRGYAFVTYVDLEDAKNAREKLNNLLVGQRHINVTWAHACVEEITKPVEKINIPVLAIAKPETKTNRDLQIQAIEAKLKMMENRQSEELTINDTVSKKAPVIAKYQHSIQNSITASKTQTKVSYRNKPYSKSKNRR